MNEIPKHIAIIMDGNRRWAKEHNVSTKNGHKAGAENLKSLIRYANKIGLEYMTVYAFSTENWKRSEEEVGALMFLFKNYLDDLVKAADTENIKIKFYGRIEELSESIQKSINQALIKTKDNSGTTLCIAFNYGGRDEITRAVKEISKDVKNDKLNLDIIDENLISNYLYSKDEPDPDLLIRTSGEERISNFLLWQIAYSEFYFVDKYWPDFGPEDLDLAIEEYQKRNRKFGGK